MRILLADKNPYDLEAMRSELSAPDVEVITARDGREVMTAAQRERPDLVIVASSLGQMGGLAVSRELKMLADRPGAAPSPPVAVLIERDADTWLAAWSRCDTWRLKPVEASDLQRLVSELTSAGGSTQTPAAP